MQPTNFVGRKNIDIHQAFWSKVDIKSENECWKFKGHKNYDYGSYRKIGSGGSPIPAHRYAWELAYGEIPKGKVIRHSCDNPLCCNPKHLLCGTQQDNIMDIYARGRMNTIRLGITKVKLYEGEIWLIRKLRVVKSRGTRNTYKFPAPIVAKMFKVSSGLILKIWRSNKMLCREGYYI